jgi:integrase
VRRIAPRNAAIGLLILYTVLRVGEVEALDIDDTQISARRGKVIIRDGKGGIYREIPLHHAARAALRTWLDVRPSRRGADDTRALFLQSGYFGGVHGVVFTDTPTSYVLTYGLPLCGSLNHVPRLS